MDLYKATLLAFIVCSTFCMSQSSEPVVFTNYGKVRGFTVTEGLKQLTRFYAVPYAKPPVNELRFMKPEKLENWEGVRDATQYGPGCMSIKLMTRLGYIPMGIDPETESEDCLTLNIYYTGDFENRMANPKAVMVFIHGGGFTSGSSYNYEGSILTAHEDVIMVSINYRLAFLGFSATNDGLISGNMGLYDQVAALIWIKENIAYFGGDNSRVTIFGESAGAMSVFFHLVSPLSEGLFHNAIMQSMVSFSPPLQNIHDQTFRLSRDHFGCDSNDSRSLLDCLRKIPAEQLHSGPMYEAPNIFLTNCIDGHFLPADPDALLASGNFHKSVNIMIGWNGDDGDSFLKYFLNWANMVENGLTTAEALGLVQNAVMPYFMFPGISAVKNQIIGDILRREYFRDQTNPLEIARSFVDLITDQSFLASSIMVTDTIANNQGNIYLYKFDYRSDKYFYGSGSFVCKIDCKAGHAEELFYMFGNASKGEGNDRMVSLSMMHGWAEFAKNGNPRFYNEELNSFELKPYTPNDRAYFLIDAPLNEASVQPIPDWIISRVQLWRTTLRNIYLLQDTYTQQASSGRDEL